MSDILQLFIALGAGILSFFSPCVLPLIPAYICFITGLSSEQVLSAEDLNFTKKRLVLTEAILFILGFSIVFVTLGASATFLGSYFSVHQRLIRIIGGIIVILFGLHITGFLNIKFLQYEKRMHLNAKPITRIGSMLVGMAFGFGWTPCVGPILGGILMLAATGATLGKGIMLLSFYSLGLALPFLLVALGIKWMFNIFAKMKRHFKLISIVSGILLIIVGLTILIPAAWTEQKAELKKAAPDFALTSLGGRTIKLSDYKDKIVILNFWAKSCPSCRRMIAELVKLYDNYKDKGVEIIGINLDRRNTGKIREFSKKENTNYPIVIGNYAVIEDYGGISFIPVTFIIDKQMNIEKKFIGYTDYETMEFEIKGLLAK